MGKMSPRKRFKTFKFKLSKQQSQSLQNYCEINDVTPNKLIKKAIKTYTQEYTDKKVGKKYLQKQQLSLFHERDEDYEQLSFFSDS